MGVQLSKTSHVLFFAGLLPALSLLAAWAVYRVIPNPPFWAETVSPLLAYALLYSLFENHLWDWRLFRLLGITTAPNVRGRWKGTQISSQQGREVTSYIEIEQTFSHIRVQAYYPRSQSTSAIGGFVESDTDIYLFYTYDSDPNSLKEGDMRAHRGTTKLKCLPTEKRLVGIYFNSIGYSGDMSFTFESTKLRHQF